MWYEFFLFELKYRFKKPETYIFFLFIFLFSLAGVEFVLEGIDLGLVRKNSPIVIAKTMAAITGLSMILVSMIMGVSIQRDYQYNIVSLIYINPISKKDYLLGHFLGSFFVLIITFSGMLWGMMLGELMPWSNSIEFLPFKIFNYLQPFLWVSLPILFFGAAVFFVTGTLTKKPIMVYTQGIFMLVLFMLSKNITNETVEAMLDPFSLSTLSKTIEGWTVDDRNKLLIPFSGILLYHQFFWFLISIAIISFGYYRFKLKVATDKTGNKKRQPKQPDTVDTFSKKLPPVVPKYNLKAQTIQLFHNTWFHSLSILKLTSFRAIVICAFIIIFVNSLSLGTSYGVDSYPTTYLIIEELQEMSVYFFAIILIFYSGEIMWKELDSKLDLIHDATSISSLVHLISKLLSLLLIYAIVIISLIAAGILFQTINGYYRYELDVYFLSFFIEIFPFLALYTALALFFQALSGNKFIGIVSFIAFVVINLSISKFGVEHPLLNFGGRLLLKYSDMNGYGHFLMPFIYVKLYWALFAILLLIIASITMKKGKETGIVNRWKTGLKQKGKYLKNLSIVCLALFIGTGAYIFYNTNILNDFVTKQDKNDFRAGYEKSLKQFEYNPQPKIVDVNLNIDLFPSKQAYEISGYYVITNTSQVPIREIHVQKLINSKVDLTNLQFDCAVTVNNAYNKYHYTIYELSRPLMPRDSMKMNFRQIRQSKGFEANGFDTKVVYNGTFFDNDELPGFGYEKQYELEDEEDRKVFGLCKKKQKAERNDKRELQNSRTGSDSHGVELNLIISTEEPQTALTSGDLINHWNNNGRNYFHYKTNQKIINFYPVLSANYERTHNKYELTGKPMSRDVDIEIYYQKGHEYNLKRMMESAKMSLDYYSTHFRPYSYRQIRIVECPGYRTFAQSLPGIIPFAETSGFIMKIDDKKDVDMAFFITAHEIAHQWWGMQLEAANVEGQKMILETLAQYSALMVFKEKYPDEKVQQFLKIQSDEYFKARLRLKEEELPLALVNNQSYLYYNLGALNMYELQKRIGEKSLNKALQKFIENWHSFNNPKRPNRYATTQDLIQSFREVTPDSLQYVITDLFESVNSPGKAKTYSKK